MLVTKALQKLAQRDDVQLALRRLVVKTEKAPTRRSERAVGIDLPETGCRYYSQHLNVAPK